MVVSSPLNLGSYLFFSYCLLKLFAAAAWLFGAYTIVLPYTHTLVYILRNHHDCYCFPTSYLTSDKLMTIQNLTNLGPVKLEMDEMN